jgi:hypothetical protein
MWLVWLCFPGILLVTACAPAQAAGHSVPPLKAGWTWYHDSRFPFQAPIPPGWRAGGFVVSYSRNTGDPSQMVECAHGVDVLPPSSTSTLSTIDEEREPILITIRIPVTCGDTVLPRDDHWFTPELHPITISGAQAIIYDNDGAGEIQRMVLTRLGGHQFVFGFQHSDTLASPDNEAQIDLGLFLGMLGGFLYTGK